MRAAFCPYCGVKASGEAAFCSSCGAKLLHVPKRP
ncbi:zinc-ribbon domain-containing protein [Bifidobacterium bifidum]|nr:zinc-ribbon domain-containing protein [Bifidobacterium bifidum]